ncbi:HemK family protein methyltransferase [bacterium]|nr:HemK family protein methyltransferase [bacterium]
MPTLDLKSLRQTVWITIKTDPTATPLDADDLIEFGCQVDRYKIRTLPNSVVSKRDWNQTLRLAEQRAAGTPTPLLTGKTIFFGLQLRVKRGVLLPRPETELLVETVLDFLQSQFHNRPVTIVELGVGTGAIGLALAHNRPSDTILGWDISARAIQLARDNQSILNVSNVTFALGNFFDQAPLWDALTDTRNPVIIVSNPPYIPTDVIATLDPSVLANDPKRALAGGKSGLLFHRKLIQLAHHRQWPLFLEIGYDQRDGITRLAHQFDLSPHIICDYGGNVRVCSMFKK